MTPTQRIIEAAILRLGLGGVEARLTRLEDERRALRAEASGLRARIAGLVGQSKAEEHLRKRREDAVTRAGYNAEIAGRDPKKAMDEHRAYLESKCRRNDE